MIIALIAGGVLLVLVLAAVFLGKGGPGARFPVGSKAWEAELTLTALLPAIANRQSEHDRTTDEKRRKRLEFEIQFLSEQVGELNAVIAAGDTSPGKGYIGFTAPPPEA
jgi:hypothetical protein